MTEIQENISLPPMNTIHIPTPITLNQSESHFSPPKIPAFCDNLPCSHEFITVEDRSDTDIVYKDVDSFDLGNSILKKRKLNELNVKTSNPILPSLTQSLPALELSSSSGIVAPTIQTFDICFVQGNLELLEEDFDKRKSVKKSKAKVIKNSDSVDKYNKSKPQQFLIIRKDSTKASLQNTVSSSTNSTFLNSNNQKELHMPEMINTENQASVQLQTALQSLQNRISYSQNQILPSFHDTCAFFDIKRKIEIPRLTFENVNEVAEIKESSNGLVTLADNGKNRDNVTIFSQYKKASDYKELVIPELIGKPRKKEEDVVNNVQKIGATEKLSEKRNVKRNNISLDQRAKSSTIAIKATGRVKSKENKGKKGKSKGRNRKVWVSPWSIAPERRKNRWQLTQEGTITREDTVAKKPSIQKDKAAKTTFYKKEIPIWETPVGTEYQAPIPNLQSKRSKNETKRSPKIRWNPTTLTKLRLEYYFKNLGEMLNCEVNHERALKLLRENNNDPKKVYKSIEGREKELVREFIVRPRRKP